MATTQFELVTPAATLFSGQAEMIVCKSVDGEIAFLADHMPYIGALDPCVVRVLGPTGATGSAAAEGAEVRVAVHGGFVEVKDNQVIMLADMARRPDEIDAATAEREQADASARLDASPSGEPDKAAEIDLKWAHARLEVLQA